MVQFVGILIAIGVTCFLAYQALLAVGTWFAATPIAWVVVAAVIAIPVVGIWWLFNREEWARQRRVEQMPGTGPMRVDIQSAESPLGLGKQRLYVDVKLSKADWRIIERAGLRESSLCDVPPSSEWERNFNRENYGNDLTPVRVMYLTKPHHYDFDNIIQLNDTKEKLIANLHALRSQIDAYQDAQAPAARKESFEL